MKTTLKITMLVLAAGLFGMAVAGLAGFPATAVVGAKILLSAFAYVGLMLVAGGDRDARRAIRLQPARVPAAGAVAPSPVRSSAYRARRSCRACVVA